MTDLIKIKSILKTLEIILRKQKELTKLRGENFNIFTILKMESKENATHSAFLGELLNPKGSHLMGNTFLKLFYETLPKPKGHVFELEGAKLKLEKHVGIKDLENKTGGRIDIYLKDKNGVTLSIENKIYASDQEAQIERYVNHNKDKNSVYYLTLKGDKAEEYTSGIYQEGRDFYNISYAQEIIYWLELCLEKSVNHPILRETIKQYIHLIKKITGTLTNNEMQEDIKELMAKNYLSAKTIEGSLWKVEHEYALKFVQELKNHLDSKLDNTFVITVDEKLNQNYSGLHISNPNWNGVKMKLEGDNQIPWRNAIFGIKASKKTYDRSKIEDKFSDLEEFKAGYKSSELWPYYRTILSFSNNENRARLFDNQIRKELVKSVGDTMFNLVILCNDRLSDVTLMNKKIPTP